METEQPKSNLPGAGGEAPRPSKRRLGLGLVIVAVVIVAIVFFRRGNAPSVNAMTDAANAPTVAVAKVDREDLFKEVTWPAEFRPYAEVELHAKVSGYLNQINVDFGDKVKAGESLATIEVPELRDELNSANATEQKAEADYTNANLVYARLVAVKHDRPDLVAQQDLDTAQAKELAGAAEVAAARADAQKYETLVAYTRITAPFDGVITRRFADPGALIQAGTASDTQSLPLVCVSDNYRLRLDFPVPVDYVQDIRVDDTVEVRVDSLGGRAITGKITRFAGKVAEDTRTMTTEIEVENPKLELVPGMYATVILKVQRRPNALAIPSQAVSGDKSPTVYVVNERGEIEVRPVTLGVETPDKFEVTSGLKEGDLVMIGNRSLVHPGEKVETKPVDQLAAR